jgi:cytochrome c
MTTIQTIAVPLELTEDEAWDLAQFLKRVGFSDYRRNAVDQDEAYRMLYVGEKVRGALADIGISQR